MKFTSENMKTQFFLFLILVIINFAFGAIEDADQEMVSPNFPYGRGVDNEPQLARILYLLAQRGMMCHPKRNSELINSLLGLPKNMNNAGK